MIDREDLCGKALEMRSRAYTPYSHFRVGAALLCKDGSIYTGCNIENVSFSATNCAERTAVFKAVSEGEREFEAIVITGDNYDYLAPCGICRQVLAEFCDFDTFSVILANDQDPAATADPAVKNQDHLRATYDPGRTASRSFSEGKPEAGQILTAEAETLPVCETERERNPNVNNIFLHRKTKKD